MSFSCQPVKFLQAGSTSFSLALSSVPRTKLKFQVGPQNQVTNNQIQRESGEESSKRGWREERRGRGLAMAMVALVQAIGHFP